MNNVNNVTINVQALPGWPSQWKSSQIIQRMFIPTTFTISPDQFKHASVIIKDIDACLRGDPTAIGPLLAELIRILHNDPYERNIYPNPYRADQVLVFTGKEWEILSLDKAQRVLFDHLVHELAMTSKFIQEPLNSVGRAAEQSYTLRPAENLKASKPELSAHLCFLAEKAKTDPDWLEAITPESSLVRTRLFLSEYYGHLEPNDLILNIDAELTMNGFLQAQEEKYAFFAEKALEAFARHLLRNHTENLTVRSYNGQIYIKTQTSWKVMPEDEVAIRQAKHFLDLLIQAIHVAKDDSLNGIAKYAETHIDDVLEAAASSKIILARYCQAADRFYGTSVP